jgi:hypothetical protein
MPLKLTFISGLIHIFQIRAILNSFHLLLYVIIIVKNLEYCLQFLANDLWVISLPQCWTNIPLIALKHKRKNCCKIFFQHLSNLNKLISSKTQVEYITYQQIITYLYFDFHMETFKLIIMCYLIQSSREGMPLFIVIITTVKLKESWTEHWNSSKRERERERESKHFIHINPATPNTQKCRIHM